MFERLNAAARRVVQLAFREARRLRHDYLGTEHLLLALLLDHDSASILRDLTLDPSTLRSQVEEFLREEEESAGLEQLPPTPALQRTVKTSEHEATQLGHALVGPEHLLLGLLHEAESQAGELLKQAGLDLEGVRRLVEQQPPSERRDFRLQGEAPSPLAFADDPSPEELQRQVGPLLPVGAGPEGEPNVATSAADRDAAGVEDQLRLTQVVLGAVLGFYFGERAGAWEMGLLAGFAGVCLALVRSSLAGAWMGFMIGCFFLPSFIGDGESTVGAWRLLLGAVGALLGSFLGDFWRRGRPRPVDPFPDVRRSTEE